MADQTHTSQNSNNRPRPQGPGPKAYVFAKPDAVKRAGKGKYDITLTLGTSHERLMHPVMVKLFIQDQSIDVYPIKEKKEITVPGFVYDPSKPFEARVAHSDNPSLTDKIALSLPEKKPPAEKPAAPTPPKPEPRQPGSFVVKAALSPDITGMFLVEITSMETDGKLLDHAFDLSATQTIEVKVGDKGKLTKGHTLPLKTQNGKLTLLVGFNRRLHEVKLMFRPDDLPSQETLLVR